MILSMQKEYTGNCKDIINRYKNLFSSINVTAKTFNEMPNVDILGIKEDNRELIWKSEMSINVGKNSIILEVSDSLLVAMDSLSGNLITFPDQLLIQGEFKPEAFNFDHNFEWIHQPSENEGIFYYFEFDGFCDKVISHYENVFDTKAVDVLTYNDVSGNMPGGEKIYDASISFTDGDKCFTIKLRDTFDSAQYNYDKYNPNALLFYKNHNPLLSIKSQDKTALESCFARLTAGAKLNKPMSKDEFGMLNGSLIDKYGICWDFSEVDLQRS